MIGKTTTWNPAQVFKTIFDAVLYQQPGLMNIASMQEAKRVSVDSNCVDSSSNEMCQIEHLLEMQRDMAVYAKRRRLDRPRHSASRKLSLYCRYPWSVDRHDHRACHHREIPNRRPTRPRTCCAPCNRENRARVLRGVPWEGARNADRRTCFATTM